MAMLRSITINHITLHLINADNLDHINTIFQGYEDSEGMLAELHENYLPFDKKGRRANFGFYTMLGNELAGMSILTVDDWHEQKGSTGADTFMHMRGRGVAPGSKPHLFYLAFELLGLNRVETGCVVSNIASRRSIEKTPGFRFEGVMRESGRNETGAFEDELIYGILRRDWQKLYAHYDVKIIW